MFKKDYNFDLNKCYDLLSYSFVDGSSDEGFVSFSAIGFSLLLFTCLKNHSCPSFAKKSYIIKEI